MKTGGVLLCLLVCLLSVYAHHDDPNPQPFTPGAVTTATIFPCNRHYYYTNGFQGAAVGTYARVEFNWTNFLAADDPSIFLGAGYIPSERQWTDFCQLGTPSTACVFYDICRVPGSLTYVTIDGGHTDALTYYFTVAARPTTPTNLGTLTGNTYSRTLYSRLSDTDLKGEPPLFYDHFYLAEPAYQPGMFLVVNITGVQSNVSTSYPSLYVNYNFLATTETSCVLTGPCSNSNSPSSTACSCTTDSGTDNCGVVVLPCTLQQTGTYFFSVKIPQLTRVNYTITANYYWPYVLPLINGAVYQYSADVTRSAHHVLHVNASQLTNSSRLRVTVNNVVGGGAYIFVQKGELAGGKDGCHTAIQKCITSWACTIYIPSCGFGAGDWYIGIDTYGGTGSYRLPLTYSIQAAIEPEPSVISLSPGDVIVTSISENNYHFYSVDIPNTVNTWLYAELYLNRNNSEVWFAMHPGSIVGPYGSCYPQPPADNWTCSTGGLSPSSSGNREACYFHLQTCYLQPGKVYFTVWSKNYTSYGHPLTYDNTFYGIATEYTLRINLDQPRAVVNNISYSEHVYANHYQHYWIAMDDVQTGEHLTVHFANAQRGTLTGYVYLNDLAGECPCYKNIRNCTATGAGGWCDLQIDTCLFQSGIWYISARGNSVLDTATVPIGYTLTVIRNPAPPIMPLELDHTRYNEIGWNESHHYKLPVPNSAYTDNLIIKIVLDQDKADAYQLQNLVAYNKFPSWYEDYFTHHCYEQYCFTGLASNSYCTIRIPACDWNALGRGGDWYLSVYTKGWTANTDPRALYTIRTFLETDPVLALASGASVYDKVQNFGYKHYYLDLTNGTGSNNLFVEVYTNNDQDLVSFRMNVNNYAGTIYSSNPSWSPCLNYLKPFECNTTTSCQWQINNCDLQPAIYYFSVYGIARAYEDPRYKQQYYDVPVEFTLTVTLYPQVQTLQFDTPVAGYLVNKGLNQYRVNITTLTTNLFQYFVLETANVRHGTVKTYVRQSVAGAKLAGPCPCYEWDWRYDTADATVTPASAIGSLILPYCWLRGNEGIYTIGVEDITPDTDATRTSVTQDLTPTAYTLTASIITPTVQTNYTVGSKVVGHVLGNNRYWHYQLNTAASVTMPQQLQIFFTNVKNGNLDVFVTSTNGAASGAQYDCGSWKATCSAKTCQFAVPDCVWNNQGTWWLSVLGHASLSVTYDMETRLKAPTTLTFLNTYNYTSLYGFVDHYKFTVVGQGNLGYLVFDIQNANNPVNVYINYASLAGPSGCKTCVHAVAAQDAPTLCTGTCKYRIPNCMFRVGDWYVAVAVTVPGTNYTIKGSQLDSGADNTPIQPFTAQTFTLNKIESWKMFSTSITNVATTPSKLIITATFGAGSATVRMFVNHTNTVGGAVCGDWSCSSDTSSTCTFRLDSCCTQTANYRFGFYQVVDGTRDVTVVVQQWAEHGTSALPLNGGAIQSGADADGVGESNYRFYRLNIPLSVFTSQQTVYLNVSILTQTSTGTLNVYLKPLYPAGSLGRCYSNIQSGTATFAAPLIWQIPFCALTNADWYIGLYNPAPNVDIPANSKPVWFSISATTYGQPIQASLGAANWLNNTIDNSLPSIQWVHFTFNVDPTDISFQKKTLRVEIIPLQGTISNLYLNYGSLAGGNYSLSGAPSFSCAGNCYSSASPTLMINVPSCSLRSGTWYAAAQIGGGNTQYAFRAQIITQNYNPLTVSQISTNPDPIVNRYQAQQILTNPSVQGTDVAYYTFTITPDMIRATTKMSLNVTDVAGGTVAVTLYRACAQTWTVSTTSSALIHDVAGFGPCDIVAGEYLLVIQANIANTQPGVWYSNYTVSVYLRDSNTYTLPMTGAAGADRDAVYTGFHDVWQIDVPQLSNPWANQTLSVKFNVSCGTIKAYLNYGTPGGPGSACNILTCTSSAVTPTNPASRYDTTCSMFLDTCQIQPGTYYLTVVGTSQNFASQYVYQQVKYEVSALAVYYNFSGISADTWYRYNTVANPTRTLTNDWRQYWYFDEETSNPGSRLKFTLNGTTGDSLYVAYENAFAVSTSPSSPKCTAPKSCTIAASATTCTVTFDSCEVKIGRYFALAKVALFPANWGNISVRAWRQEVDIPYLWPNQVATGTVGDDYPQFYKILVINPTDTEFYGEFTIFNVDLGTVTGTLSHVDFGHQTPGQTGGCLSPLFNKACTATKTANCTVSIPPCYAGSNLTFFWEIDWTSYENPAINRSVRYSVVYTLRPPVMTLPLFTRVCDVVHTGKYRHWKLSPQASVPEQILWVNITTLYSPETVSLSLNDYPNRLGIESGSTNTYGSCFRNYWLGNAPDTVTNTGVITEYECAYTDFHIGVLGKTVTDDLIGIKYLIEARVQQAPIINLTLATPTYFCKGARYYFKVTVPTNTAFFQVVVDFEVNTETGNFWVKQGSLAAPNCYDKTATGTDVIGTWFIQSCGLPSGVYYITVNSPNSPFTITAKTTAKAPIAIGNTTAAAGTAIKTTPDADATIPIYSINVTSAQLATLTTPQLDFWLSFNGANGGLQVKNIYFSDGSAGNASAICDVPFAAVQISSGTWKYTVRNCHINTGTYYAVLSSTADDCQAAPGYFLNSGAVSYSITAAVTQTFAPVSIALGVVQNTTILSNAVQHYYINGTQASGKFLYVRIYNVAKATPLSVMWSPYRPVDVTATAVSFHGTNCVNGPVSTTTNDWNARYYATAAVIGSNVFRIDACAYTPADKIYFMITSAVGDGCAKQPFAISYNFVVSEAVWTPLVAGAAAISEVMGENRESRFYSISSGSMQAVTLRVTPTLADVQVAITVQDNECDKKVEYAWNKNCVPGQYCDIEIPTRAAHPEKDRFTFYIIVNGNRANYTIQWWNGLQNCGVPQFTATSFCGTDVVNYATWNWNNWQALDDHARGLFEKLYLDFHYSHDFPCYVNCNTSLRQYACHEVFRMCDGAGFITPVCRASCDHVVYYCQNWFDTVQNRQMNCTSHQYGDTFFGNCTGLDVKVPYPPNSFVNIQGAVAGASLLAPSVLVILALLALYFL